MSKKTYAVTYREGETTKVLTVKTSSKLKAGQAVKSYLDDKGMYEAVILGVGEVN